MDVSVYVCVCPTMALITIRIWHDNFANEWVYCLGHLDFVKLFVQVLYHSWCSIYMFTALWFSFEIGILYEVLVAVWHLYAKKNDTPTSSFVFGMNIFRIVDIYCELTNSTLHYEQSQRLYIVTRVSFYGHLDGWVICVCVCGFYLSQFHTTSSHFMRWATFPKQIVC